MVSDLYSSICIVDAAIDIMRLLRTAKGVEYHDPLPVFDSLDGVCRPLHKFHQRLAGVVAVQGTKQMEEISVKAAEG